LIVGASAIALPASAYTFARAAENWSRMAQEHHACTVVLGLDRLETSTTSASEASGKLVRMGSSADGRELPQRMRPEGTGARNASFRRVRDERRIISVNANITG
jgi:hypothetical protein